MANPQIEDGHLKIADTLLLALSERRFTATQYRIMLSIMFLTYRAGKTKAKMSVQDIRYICGARNDEIVKALEQLMQWKVIYCQVTKDKQIIVGIQKDYERWLSPPLTDKKTANFANIAYEESITNNNKTLRGVEGGLAPTERLLAEFQFRLNRSFPPTVFKQERKKAKELYLVALAKTKDPEGAMNLILDCLDFLDTPSFRAAVNLPVTVVSQRFGDYVKQIPSKPRSIREQEEVLKHRFRYDVRTKNWVMS